MKCKFCGCTDARACAIPMVLTGEDEQPSIAVAGQLAQFTVPCEWIAPRVCSAPACVDQAYREACDTVSRILLEEIAA